jgi:hypothetical protein
LHLLSNGSRRNYHFTFIIDFDYTVAVSVTLIFATKTATTTSLIPPLPPPLAAGVAGCAVRGATRLNQDPSHGRDIVSVDVFSHGSRHVEGVETPRGRQVKTSFQLSTHAVAFELLYALSPKSPERIP